MKIRKSKRKNYEWENAIEIMLPVLLKVILTSNKKKIFKRRIEIIFPVMSHLYI